MKKFFKKHAKPCIAVLALSLVTVGATLALMVSASNSVTNQFAAAEIDTEIKEELDNDMTKQVSITNQGRSDAYVRARLMVSGVDRDIDVEAVTSEEAADEEQPSTVYLVMPNVSESVQGKWCPDESNPDEWLYGAGVGYYYYLDVLPGTDSEPIDANRKTPELLMKVVLSKDLQEDKDFLEKFSVSIYHESVLAINQPETVTLQVVKDAFTAAENSGN